MSRAAIDRPRLVIVSTALVIAISAMAALNISVQRTPAISKAVIMVAVPHPGAQPSEVEEQITRKIEEKLQGLKNVDFISSTSMRGSSVTQVIFLDGVDPKFAKGEVKDLVDQVRRELPRGREVEPIVTDIDFENAPLMLVNLVGPEGFDERRLKKIAEDVEETLKDVAGVASTQLFGGREREFHVNVNVDLALEYGLTIGDLRRALSEFHAEMPGGALETGQFDSHVRSNTKFRSLEDIEQVVVSLNAEDGIIRISDVAEVIDTNRRLKNVALLDGSSCATIIVYKESNTNTLKASKALHRKVEDLKSQYPSIQFSITRDTSEEISVMFRVLGSSFIFGAMLVLIFLGWSMGLRTSVLVLIAVPFSSGVGLSALYFLDMPISNMVIFSFILVLGMVVDGAIIVAENIHRHIERGEDPVEAAKVGIEEVGMPVIMADLTTIAAYLPMLLVPGIMGDFMGVMPVVVTVSLAGSILVDHFIIPAAAARWYHRRKLSAEAETLSGNPTDTPDILNPATSTATPQLNQPRMGFFTGLYSCVLRWSLSHRWAIVACGMLAILWARLMLNHIGFTFFPPSDRGQFEVKYELPLGYSVEETIRASRVITEPLQIMQAQKNSGVVHFVSAIGSSEGLSSRLENDPAVGPEFGTVMVQLLSPLDRTRHETDIIAELRRGIDERIHRYPGMTYSVHQVEEGPPGGADVAIRVTGDNHALLGAIAVELSRRLEIVPGTVDSRSSYRAENPEIVVDPNLAVMPFYGISKSQIASAVQTFIEGDTTIELSLDDEDITLRLQASAPYRDDLTSLERLMITGPTGRRASLGELADVRRSSGVYAVNRYKRKRAVVAECNVQLPTQPDDVFVVLRSDILPSLGFQAIEQAADESIFAKLSTLLGRPSDNKKAVSFVGQPGTAAEGMRATFTGENEERDKNFSYLVNCMVIAVVLIFAILVFQFNSFRQSIVVILTVPLSFIGVVAGMWICSFPFSLATFIGLVSLAGVVVNDAIVVVDFINRERQRGGPLREAIVRAGVHRLRPVLLTTVTTIGGLLPLFLNLSGGAEFWQPLTGAIVFGLGFATVLTLVVIPVSYSLFYNREFRQLA